MLNTETNSVLNNRHEPKDTNLVYQTLLNGLLMQTNSLTRKDFDQIFRKYKKDIRVCVTNISLDAKYKIEITFQNYIVYILNKTYKYYLPNQRLVNIIVDISEIEKFL